MNEVEFKYNLRSEIRAITTIYENYTFFKTMNYGVCYPSISEEAKRLLILDASGQKAISLLIQEFEPIFESEIEIYKQGLLIAQNNWTKIEQDFFNTLKKSTRLQVLGKYKGLISLYGPGGSFYEPDEISIRLNPKNQKDAAEANLTIAHEIIHLAISDLVMEHKLRFEDIERVVDLILTKTELRSLFADPKMQDMGNPAMDSIFQKKNYNVKEAIREFAFIND